MEREILNQHTDRQIHDKGFFRKRPTFVLFLLLSLLSLKSYSQNNNPLISFSVGSCTLDVALEKLFAEYELNVAFSKDELSKIRIESYSCSYKSLEEVLTDLLKGTDYGFKRVGKQYVIRKNQQLESAANDPAIQPPVEQHQEAVVHKTDTVAAKVSDTVRLYDTTLVIRTVMRYDTIVRVEKVVETDTVYQVRYKGLEIPWPSFKDNGWFVAPSVACDFGHFDFTDKLNATNATNATTDIAPSSAFGVGLDAGFKHNRLSVGGSLSYRSVKYRFSLEQTVYQGDYYVNDTLDTYYVVHPVSGDTAFHYILDSLYVPLVTTQYAFRDINRIDYLSVGLFASFDFWKREHFRMYVKAGVSADFLVSSGGSFNNLEEPFHSSISQEQVEQVRFSYFGGLGAAVKIVNRVEIVPEVLFRQTNGSLYRAGFPFDLRMRLWECRLGLNYYF